MKPEEEKEQTRIDEPYEVEYIDHGNTICEHEYVYTESDPNSNLVSVACTKCFHGASIDGTKHKVEDGKLVQK